MSFYTITPQIYVCTKNREKKKARESCHTRIPLKFVPMTCVPCLTRMNESCHTCHAYEWVMSHIWMSHGTHTNESCHTYEWGMARIWMSHGTHVNESWHTYKCVLPHIRMSHVTHTSESWHTYAWVMAHMWMRDCTHMNESRHTYEWVMAHIWMGHGTHMNESCHTYEWVMAHIWMSHGTHMDESCLIHMNETWHTYAWVMAHTWMKIWVLPRKMRHVTRVNESRRTHECSMPPNEKGNPPKWKGSYHENLSNTAKNETCHLSESDMAHIYMSHGTHMNENLSITAKNEAIPLPSLLTDCSLGPVCVCVCSNIKIKN